jgi:hypothetical protein
MPKAQTEAPKAWAEAQKTQTEAPKARAAMPKAQNLFISGMFWRNLQQKQT